MLTHYPYQQLGQADHGWLKAKHHFSFGQYYNPERMAFGSLRVINDDQIQAHNGFAPHAHNNMEIITIVRTGAVSHEDNAGNKGVTKAGEVQVMSAGSGIIHSEFNHTDEALTLYQIWIDTNKRDVKPRWDSQLFPTELSHKQLPLLVSGYDEDKGEALFIHQQAKIFGGKLQQGGEVIQPIMHQAYVLASQGSIELSLNQQTLVLEKGDGAEITNSKKVKIKALTNSEVVIIDAI